MAALVGGRVGVAALARGRIGGLPARWCRDVALVQREAAQAAVGQEPAQRGLYRAEGDLVPGDVLFVEQPGVEAFFARIQFGGQQAGAVERVDLLGMGDIQNGEERAVDFGAGT